MIKVPGLARIHLVQDLKTIDPNGDTVPKLSKDAMNVVKESGEPEYKSIDFQYTYQFLQILPPVDIKW